MGRVERAQGDDHDNPIGRQDAQGAAREVRAGCRTSAAGQDRARPGTVEQQSGQDEEDRNADIAAADYPGRGCSGEREPGLPADVGEQHRECCENPDAV